MVLCTSVSKTLKKQSLHICCPVFGRLKIAFAFWQRAQLFGAMIESQVEKTSAEIYPRAGGSTRLNGALEHFALYANFD